MVDRDQTRRNAETALNGGDGVTNLGLDSLHLSFARDVLALLSELEEVEAEMERNRAGFKGWQERAFAAEARLAKVPALVEALREIKRIGYTTGYSKQACATRATYALSVWEQDPDGSVAQYWTQKMTELYDKRHG